MSGWDYGEDTDDGVQYDDMHAASPGHLEADAIRQECRRDLCHCGMPERPHSQARCQYRFTRVEAAQ